MKFVFDPIVDRVIKLVQKQVNQAHRQRKAKIHVSFSMTLPYLGSRLHFLTSMKRIVLVGGMGSSKYLYSRLLSWCASIEKIELLCPEHP